MKKIIVDTLGSDFGCEPIIKGSLRALAENPDIFIIFAGNENDIKRIAGKCNADMSRISILHTDEFVPDNAPPTFVFRGGDNTSMVKAIELLKKEKDITGLISAGNTGALLVSVTFRLGLADGLRCPALATALPCKKEGKVCLVDCGANTDCTPEDLKKYAVMGNAFIKSLEGIDNPKVALMSVGPSPTKGNTLVKEAYPLIEKLPVNFIGNIEGNDMVNTEADVIVTDGFTGNILLKNTEAAGMAAISIIKSMASELPEYNNIIEKLRQMFSFNDRGGAVFLGASKTVVKMHGCANEDTAYSCVNLVLTLESREFSKNICADLKSL